MEQKKHNIGHFFFGRDMFDRIGQSAAFTALFNKLVHYFTLLVLSRVGTCWLLGVGWQRNSDKQIDIGISSNKDLVCRGGTKKIFFLRVGQVLPDVD